MHISYGRPRLRYSAIGRLTDSQNVQAIYLEAGSEGSSDPATSAEGSRAAEEAEEAAGALDSSRRWALEQLAGVCSLPNVDAAIQTSITRYLITHSFFASQEVDHPLFLRPGLLLCYQI